MMAIFNEELFSKLMYHNGRPFVPLEADEGVDPALEQVLSKRTELVIEITVPVERANDLIHVHVLHAKQFSAGACALYLFVELDQL